MDLILGPRVEGEKETNMPVATSNTVLENTVPEAANAATQARSARRSQIIPLAFAGLLGVFIVGFAGFVQIDAVHNAGHDYRHSMAFPCH